MRILVDSNIFIDILEPTDRWHEWSAARLAECRQAAELVINPLIYAEVSIDFTDPRELDRRLGDDIAREDLPWDAAFLAAQAFLKYRRAGGVKTSPLPDFYVGAHALVKGYELLTRDAKRYKTYFPKLKLIAP